ncbi:hypothetical protein XabCFBP2524_06650 [Xanthomonas axonopodis pv. begoniae]|nr:hypothetical protein XabCFBP2524_06650 [Xanthomonas axonopodis pv. begoniae]
MQRTCGEVAWGPPTAEHAARLVWQRHAKQPQACACLGNAAGGPGEDGDAGLGWVAAMVGGGRRLACRCAGRSLHRGGHLWMRPFV